MHNIVPQGFHLTTFQTMYILTRMFITSWNMMIRVFCSWLYKLEFFTSWTMLNMFARSFSTIWWGLGRAAGLPCRGNLQVTFFEKPIFSSPIGKRFQKIKWDILPRNVHLSVFPCKLYGSCTLHCKEIWIYAFPEKELRGLSSYFLIHVSVHDLYIPTIGPHIFLQ